MEYLKISRKYTIYRGKSWMKRIPAFGWICFCFCLLSLLLSCSEEEKRNGNDGNDFYLIHLRVDGGTGFTNHTGKVTRAANPAGSEVEMEDIVLFTVAQESRMILNAVRLEEQTNHVYSCRIPSEIDLLSAEFYAVANVRANFGDVASLENTSFDTFLNRSVKMTHDDNNIAASSSAALHYPLMNKVAATYDTATGAISDMLLSHLPARIYLDCERLGYPIDSITFNNVSRITSLRTVIESTGNGNADDLFIWTDTLPGIAGDGTDYYYLVYPSDQQASVVVTSVDTEPVSADLGYLKPGHSYTIRLNYPVKISFDEIAADGKINIAKGSASEWEFKVANTAIFRKIELTSGDESIFEVTGGVDTDWNKFTLKGIHPGEATLTAECMGATVSCTVVVSDDIHTVTVNGELMGRYAAGEEVTVRAPFKERLKFTHWTTDLGATATDALDLNSPVLTFTMPASAVSFTAEYVDAPRKVTIHKPGKIVNSRDGQFEAALAEETETSYIRYYAMNDEVRIQAPQVSPDAGTEFMVWTASSDNLYYYINSAGGGGQHPTTWFKMGISTDVELTPTYKNAPYWSSRATAKGHIIANFIDRENTVPGQLTIPGGAALYRSYSSEEKEVIMRALNTIENTFANAPRRTIKITFSVYNEPGATTGGGTEPVMAHHSPPYDAPKSTWLASDFGGRATGIKAASSKFEAVWRDQLNIAPDDADEENRFVGDCDGYVLLNHSYIKDLYKGESEGGIGSYQFDFESLVLHEVGHIVCYHSFNSTGPTESGLLALDVFVATASDPENKNVVKGTFVDDGSYPIIYNEFVKSYTPDGGYLQLRSGDFGHIAGVGTGIGAFTTMMGKCCRKFADFELAFLSEMGWQINPAAWEHPPTPTEPPLEAGLLFAEGVTLESGWYDQNKSRGAGGFSMDSNLCWAAATTNMIQWWLDRYVADGRTIPQNAPHGFLPGRENATYRQFAIFEEFCDPNIAGDPFPEIPDYFTTYFPHIFPNADPFYDNTILHEIYPETLKEFSDYVVNGLKNRGVIYMAAGGHARTLWGCRYNTKTGIVEKIYYTDSDDRQVVLWKDVVVKVSPNGRPMIGGISKEIYNITILYYRV